ncbi:MAG: hypothetical protein K2X66_12715 [Cyanobacteria bacterium]|nr:hypothetical protein [Cyanobacteriota bacterium]
MISLEKRQLPPLQKPISSTFHQQATQIASSPSGESFAPSLLFASADSDRLDLQERTAVPEAPSGQPATGSSNPTSSKPASSNAASTQSSSSPSSSMLDKIKSFPSLVWSRGLSLVRSIFNRAYEGYENVSQWGVFSPLRKIKFFQRLHNAVDNGLGVPRYAKPVKALTWAGATLAVGLIPFPLFTPLIMASPVTFATTLLVDYFMGFWEGLTSDPVKMRERLDQAKQSQ